MATDSLAASISASLVAQGLPAPSAAFLSSIVSPARPTSTTPSAAALLATAKHRLLHLDLADPSLDLLDPAARAHPAAAFPPRLADPQTPAARLPGPLLVQVVDAEDLARSRAEQLDALEERERGERMRGRVVLKIADDEKDEAGAAAPGSTPNALLRLTLQDVRGQRVYALEITPLRRKEAEISMGAKVVLRNAEVARGVVMLEPATATVLGGKVDGMHRAWVEGRKARLKAALGGE